MAEPVLADDERLRMYLLGALEPEAEMQVDAWLLASPDHLEWLFIVEEELIDSYVCDELSARESEQFVARFLTTPEQKRKVRLASALHRQAKVMGQTPLPKLVVAPVPGITGARPPALRQRRLRWSAALATTSVVLVVAAWFFFFRPTKNPRPATDSQVADSERLNIEQGLAALNRAYREGRPVESRLYGFDHRVWREGRVERGGGPGKAQAPIDQVALDRAARLLLAEADERPNVQSLTAAGRYYLVSGNVAQATKLLADAIRLNPKDAVAHADLGAALFEKGKAEQDVSQRAKLFGQSLEHLNQALQLDGSLLPALYNRALLYERINLPQAEADWQRYLERDAQSGWAEEARQRLNAIEEKKRRAAQDRDRSLPGFLAAYASGDYERAWAIANRSKEAINGQIIFEQLASASLARSDPGARVEAARALQALLQLGLWELHKTKDPYVLELARFYRVLDREQLATLHSAYDIARQARDLYRAADYQQAAGLYEQASRQFKRAGDRWSARLAAYRLNACYQQLKQTERSLGLLGDLERVSAGGHHWLLAQVLSSAGRAHAARNEHSKAIECFNRARQLSERINDGYNLQRTLAQLAAQSLRLGDHTAALTRLAHALALVDTEWPGIRQMWRTYDTASLVFSAVNLPVLAAAYSQAALQLARQENDPSFISLSQVELGVSYGRLNRYEEGLAQIKQGFETGRAMRDYHARIDAMAYAALQLGHLHRLQGDWRQALTAYDQAIDLYTELGFKAVVYYAHKGRLLCQLGRRDVSGAEAELAATLELFEQHRAAITGDSERTTFFDHEHEIYDLAVSLEFSGKGNRTSAFDYAEAARARGLLDLIGGDKQAVTQTATQARATPLKLAELQARLPASAHLLQYTVLADRLLIWTISRSKFAVKEQFISRRQLDEAIRAYVGAIIDLRTGEEVVRQAKALYDLLINPVAASFHPDELVCIVPDGPLNYLPFGALVVPQSGRPFLSKQRFVLAPSATVFVLCSELARARGVTRTDERALVVGNPSFDRAIYPLDPLPSAVGEATAVAKLYRRPTLLLAREADEESVRRALAQADVIHLASHYVIDPRVPGASGLLLSPKRKRSNQPQADGVLQAQEVIAMMLPRAPLVTLSACATGVERSYSGEGAVGAARAFLSAGAPLVVASLWPVDSEATAELMSNFHRLRREAHLPTSEALRQAQLALCNGTRRRYQQPYYWAAFAAIGGGAEI